LLQDGPLSKDAVSRLVGRLKDEFEQWRQRDLASEQVRYLFLDGWYPKVRSGKKRVVVPVLVVLGVRADGRKVPVAEWGNPPKCGCPTCGPRQSGNRQQRHGRKSTAFPSR
jgi:hypothetical protein